MYKWYAPQYWLKPGGGVSFKARSDDVLDLREFAAFKRAEAESTLASVRATASGADNAIGSGGASGGGSGFDWLRVVEAVAGAAHDDAGSDDDSGGGDSIFKNFSDTDTGGGGSLLSDAQPFEYQSDLPGGDVFEAASQQTKTPNTGDPGTWYTNPGSGHMRLYGDTGAPVIDLDFDHVHNGLRPHAHNWNHEVRDGGIDVVPFSPWNP
ncbi:hypothetical protein [Caballeronia cordobensis]|uniref:hypothetical protein n=1 Tax=Caballeronia cordobensis TaxID=1353886 RepID=UPI00045F0243|nr:putative uncharacterized protein [Burkholderia sp. RPE67]